MCFSFYLIQLFRQISGSYTQHSRDGNVHVFRVNGELHPKFPGKHATDSITYFVAGDRSSIGQVIFPDVLVKLQSRGAQPPFRFTLIKSTCEFPM